MHALNSNGSILHDIPVGLPQLQDEPSVHFSDGDPLNGVFFRATSLPAASYTVSEEDSHPAPTTRFSL